MSEQLLYEQRYWCDGPECVCLQCRWVGCWDEGIATFKATFSVNPGTVNCPKCGSKLEDYSK